MLDRYDYALFDENDFEQIIGEQITDKLQDRGIDNYATYFITYVSLLIQSHIREYTGLNLYKEYDDNTPNDYELCLGLSKQKKTIVEAYIVGDYNTPEWLSLEEGGEPLIPSKKVRYKIMTDGAYKNKYYGFDGKVWYPSDSVDITYRIDLTEDQINFVKLACVYEADYLIDNGSTERMTAMGMVNRSNKYDKYDLHEFEICSVSHNLLANAGLLYQGIGGGLYAKLK